MKHALTIACLTLALVASRSAYAVEPASIDCPSSEQYSQLGTTLPATATALRRGDEVVVVAFGSSSTLGVGASDRKHTYPARLESELQRLWPHQRVRVINKGIGGEDVDQMAKRIERDVLSYNPDLVIWQTGTNLMLQSGSTENLLARLRSGIRTLKGDHIDVVLMDPQFAPKVTEVPDHMGYITTIGATADEQHVGLFHRFALMSNWVETHAFVVDDIISPDNLHMNDISYTCISRALAAGIVDAVRATPMPMATKRSSPAR